MFNSVDLDSHKVKLSRDDTNSLDHVDVCIPDAVANLRRVTGIPVPTLPQLVVFHF